MTEKNGKDRLSFENNSGAFRDMGEVIKKIDFYNQKIERCLNTIKLQYNKTKLDFDKK